MDSTKLPVSFQRIGNLSLEQQEILEKLTTYIFENVSKQVRYDHIALPIKKSDLDMRFKGKWMDIAFVYKNKLILIDVETRPLQENPGAAGQDTSVRSY